MKIEVDITEVLYRIVGQRILEIRQKNKVSQQMLAEAIRVSRPALSNMEVGRQGISLIHLFKICEYFKCELSVLVPSPLPEKQKKEYRESPCVKISYPEDGEIST